MTFESEVNTRSRLPRPARSGPFRFAVYILLTLTAATFVGAQTLDRGEIRGTVRDESGDVLVDAAVTLRDVNTGFQRSLRTNSSGQYTGVLLPVGEYVLSAQKTGFATTESAVVPLRVGQSLVVNLVLKVAAIQTSVEVVAAASDTVVGIGHVVESSAISNLPLNGRDYRDFAQLAPTVTPTMGARGTFKVGGQAGDYLALLVDGGDFTNNFFGEFFGSIEQNNFTIPLEAVQEFKVTAGGFGAEFGRSNGGLVNVVTKSGSNSVHGSLAYFLRDGSLTARDAFGNSAHNFRRHQFGGSFGGPIKRDKAFYFFAADLQRQSVPITVRFSRPVTGVAIPELGISDLHSLEGQYPRKNDLTTGLGKIDLQLSEAHQLGFRLNYSRAKGTNIGGDSLILSRATSNLESFENGGPSLIGSLRSSFGPNLYTELKFQFSREDRPRREQAPGPQVQISDTGTFGRFQGLPSTQDMFRYQVSANVSRIAGTHTLRFGGDYNAFNMRNNFFALAEGGAYTFPTLEAFRARTPSLYGQYFGLGGRSSTEAATLDSYWQTELAFYLQDQWRPTSRLSVGYGLRYDAQFNPKPSSRVAGVRVPVGPPRDNQVTFANIPQGIPHDLNNFGPRFDLAYDFKGDGATLLRVGGGLYYGRTPIIYFPMRGRGTIDTNIFAPPSAFGGLVFPNVLPSAIAPGSPLEQIVPRPSIIYVDPDFQNPRVLNTSLTLTRRLGSAWSAQVGYLFSDSRNLRIGGHRSSVWDRNLNPPTQLDQFGRGINLLAGGRPDTTISQANALTSFGRGRYNALTVEVRRQPFHNWQAYASYTLARSKGNESPERDTEAAFGPSDPFNLERDYGTNELDLRHSFKAYLQAALPYRFFFGSTWTAASGLAFAVYNPTDTNGDRATSSGLNPDRPVVNGQLLERFPFHQPGRFVWDLRFGRGFQLGEERRLQPMVEVFNVLNTKNTFADPVTNAIYGTPNFRAKNRTLGPRILQLGIRYDF